MAYVSQEKKQTACAALKSAIPQTWKWSLAVQHHSTLVLTIYSAPVDLVRAYVSQRCSDEVREHCLRQMHVDLNPYHWREHFVDSVLQGVFARIFDAMNQGNWDRSDIQTDYFDVGHYVAVQLGRWNKPFEVR